LNEPAQALGGRQKFQPSARGISLEFIIAPDIFKGTGFS
jgi:hypothetical protein